MSLDVQLVYRLRNKVVAVFTANITDNLGKMASEAGMYEILWRPEKIDIAKAGQLIGPLTDGLTKLLDASDRSQAFNPPNGWGRYEVLVDFVRRCLDACRQHPDAQVEVSR